VTITLEHLLVRATTDRPPRASCLTCSALVPGFGQDGGPPSFADGHKRALLARLRERYEQPLTAEPGCRQFSGAARWLINEKQPRCSGLRQGGSLRGIRPVRSAVRQRVEDQPERRLVRQPRAVCLAVVVSDSVP
jgi:hypothetical protein